MAENHFCLGSSPRSFCIQFDRAAGDGSQRGRERERIQTGPLGFEPRQNDSESFVLPLHQGPNRRGTLRFESARVKAYQMERQSASWHALHAKVTLSNEDRASAVGLGFLPTPIEFRKSACVCLAGTVAGCLPDRSQSARHRLRCPDRNRIGSCHQRRFVRA